MSAYHYVDYTARIHDRKNDIDQRAQDKADLERSRKDRLKEKAGAEAQSKAVAKKRDEEMQKDGKIRVLEEDMAKHEKEAAKVQAQVEIVEGVIKENKAKAAEVQEALDQVRSGFGFPIGC